MAVKTLLVLLSLFRILGSADAQSAETGDADFVRIGVSVKSFETISRNDASAALKAWATTVAKEQNLKVVPRILLYDSADKLRTDVLGERLDAVALTTEELMFIGIRCDSIFLPAPAQGFFIRYSVVVRRDSGISLIAGLAGRKVATTQTTWMVLAQPWLETILAGAAGRAGEPVDFIMTENPAKGILQVFFRQTDAVLVTVDAFELACELNPQLRKDLVVLATSPPFITSFLIFRPNFQFREKFETAIMDLHTTPGGRQVLTVFQSSRMEKRPISILDDTWRFLAEYQRLRPNSQPVRAQP